MPSFSKSALVLAVGAIAHKLELAEKVTPVEKVISMITELKTEAENEAKQEASDYGKFACWCKTATEEKSTSILNGQDEIETQTANIQTDTATKEDKLKEIDERNVKHEELEAKLAETKARLAKETAVYEATDADLTKAISSLEGAIQSMADTGGTRFLQASTKKSIKDSLELAQVFDIMPAEKKKAVTAFLQSTVDPSDPDAKYHSQGIIDVMVEVKADFVANKAEVDAEWEKTEEAENNLITQTESDIDTNSNAVAALKTDVDNLNVALAEARKALVDADDLLKDDQLYLKDTTARCEQRAAAFDQRSAMRGDELSALTKALDILENKVQSKDEAANVRAFLQQHEVVFKDVPSFMQLAAVHAHSTVAYTSDESMNIVITNLRNTGFRIGSSTLSTLALKLSTSADPFAKVKELIQKLIERLISEATAEADKKGFCDLRVSKAEKNRLHRWEDVTRLNSELAALGAKQDQLEYDIEQLTNQVGNLKTSIEEDAANREGDHDTNMQTLQDAKDGLAAVSEALMVLKTFYKQAAKGSVLLQMHASPIAGEADVASGAYKGNQEASTAILGLLEVIKSDFERTIKNTEEEEATDAAAHVKSHRVAFSDQKGKELKKKMNEEDLETTKNSIAQKSGEMQTNMDLVDAALEETEKLKPLCIDTGMTYAERVAKREEEIGALKTAMCQLDGEKVETDFCTDNGGTWEAKSE